MRAFIITVLAVALSSLPTIAQTPGANCGKRADIVRMLAKQKEMPRALGVTDTDYLEIYTAPDGTWSILITQSHGRRTCIMATGHSWEITPQQIPGTAS